MEIKRVLIVAREPAIGRSLASDLKGCCQAVEVVEDSAQGLAAARTRPFDAVLIDLPAPQPGGQEVISALQSEQPRLPIVVVASTSALGDAIEALRHGAWDYVTKPFQDVGQVLVVIERVMEKAALIAERDRYQRELEALNRSLEAEVARQTEDLRAQNRELAALNRVSYAISAPLDLDTILSRTIDASLTAVQADAGLIRLLNPVTNHLVVAVARELPEAFLTTASAIPLGQGIAGQVARSGHPRCGSDLGSDPWMAALACDRTGGVRDAEFHSYLCVPLHAGAQIVGTLEVVTRAARDFGSREIELATTIANQAGVVVARAQYAADLEQANAELRRLDTLREQFIQNVSHELRTPLALVHGYIEMLAQGGIDSRRQSHALDIAARRVRALVALVESITTLQDLDSQPLSLDKVKPEELIQTAVKMTAQRASAARVKLQVDCQDNLPPFTGDFIRLAQALHQVLDNACKFSSPGSTVTVAAWTVPASGTFAVSVHDHGIGIPPEEHERIFERFYQVDGSIRRHYGGVGLGLAIAREIIEAHGGQVAVQSKGRPGQGSTFTISLPALPFEESKLD